ncbi:MAG: hypothetical protein HY393_02680 [Candidatus Diapherotrites archaeon]|nr:hypothetical protein [Candidatus Diapherotrites archaeon]
MTKVKCPECEERFDLDVIEYDDNDTVECPECYAALLVRVQEGKVRVVPETEKYEDITIEEE